MTNEQATEHPVFVVLGATGSVGSELSRRLVASGAQVVLGGRNSEKLDELSAELNATSHIVDANRPESIRECLQLAVESHGRIDGVVNCIGSVLLKAAHMTSDTEWNDTIAVNLTSAFCVVGAAGKLMRRTGGSVVLISSAAAQIGLANHEAIAAAKAGIIGLTRSAAATYASRGIRVNAVAPGLVKSQMTKSVWGTPTAESASIAMHALGRLGEPSDIASAIEWLLQPANTWITGQVIGVDGGLSTIAPKNKLVK
ncbi:3-oxoacyl-[acyl-carrier-protein] reductase FabG [Symmachiella macrocystis]|uniref:3-oxoacyl-[acyl-carrier-protein] reductase FabG n=1 Tax=Symmachiella macrocystis TaxID=2527985 RepID=A0A5C6AZW7_9PLAN|nr:SDR family oxidoreductase [Symmachiella macrocystis]TWU05198.1 3-oxoacyl-[acyl-carrier-protein] reductase FabG [Symmachiella macrocystis]